MLPEGYSMIPPTLLAPNQPARINIYIYMPANRNLVHFKRKDELVSVADFAKLGGLSPFQVLTPISDYQAAIKGTATRIVASARANKGELTQETKAMAEGVMLTLTGDEEKITLDTTRYALDETAELVKEVIKVFQPLSASGAKAFEEILETLKQNDPIMNHNRHVGALTGLLMMSAGGFSMEEVADASFAGFVHDYSLGALPKVLIDRHLSGDDLSQAASKAPEFGYVRHIDYILKKLETDGITITPGTAKIIEQHHENYDGNGLRGMVGPKIYRPARVVRIADDLISLINRPENPRTLRVAVEELWKLTSFGRNVYDPDMLKLVRDAVIAQTKSVG